MSLETALATIGKLIVNRAATEWLKQRAAEKDQHRSLTDLVRMHYSDRFKRREFERQMSAVADEVEMRLAQTVDQEFRYLDEGERQASLDAVVHLFETTDLSDMALFEMDLDPIRLAQSLRDADRRLSSVGLSDEGDAYFNRILFESCACLVRFVRQLPEFEPRAHIETLRRLSSLAEEIRYGFQQLPRPARSDASFDDDNYFLQQYLAYVSQNFDELELFGVDPREKSNRMSLTVAYLSVSVSRRRTTVVLPPGRGRYRDHGPLGESTSRLRAESALADGRLTIIRGEAGSGKTTLLKWLAIQAARGIFGAPLESWNDLVPIFLPLRKLWSADMPSSSEWLRLSQPLVSDLEPDKWVLRQLKQGRVLLLIDGVDELGLSQRRNVAHWIRQMLSLYELRVVVTSRPTAIPDDWLSDVGFNGLMIEPMNPDDIASFVRHWHDAVWQVIKRDEPLRITRDTIDGQEQSLSRQLDARPHLRNLAISPLLCAMLCALNFRRRGYLPRDRMDLYNAVLELLLEVRDTARGIPSARNFPLNYRQKIYLLQGLAWRLSERTRSEVSKEKATAWLHHRLRPMSLSGARMDGSEAIEYLLLRSGVIREPAPGRIDFIHRSFLEYLAGKEAAEEDHIDLLVAKAHLDHWRETVVMAASHGRPHVQEELLGGILDRADHEPKHARTLRLVAIACLEAVTSLSEALQDRLLDCLASCVPPRNTSEARSVAAAGDVLLRHLPDSLEAFSPSASAAVVRAVVYVGGADALNVLARYGTDRRRRVIAELVDGWPYFDAEEYATRVLAKSPLPGGTLSVVGSRTLKATDHLRHLDDLNVRISINDIDDLQTATKLSTLVVDGRFAGKSSDIDLRRLDHLPALTRLIVEATLPPETAMQVSELSQLTHLHLNLSGSPQDVSFLEPLGRLESLHLQPLHKVADLSPMLGLRSLQELSVWRFGVHTRIRTGMLPDSLTDLTIAETYDEGVTRHIAALPNLEKLRIFQSDHLTRLSPLTALNLSELWLRDCNSLEQMSAISGFSNIRTLVLIDCPGDDLNFLADLPRLRYLFLRSDVTLDLDILQSHTGPLDVFLGQGQDFTGLARSRKSRLLVHRLDALGLRWTRNSGWIPQPTAHALTVTG